MVSQPITGRPELCGIGAAASSTWAGPGLANALRRRWRPLPEQHEGHYGVGCEQFYLGGVSAEDGSVAAASASNGPGLADLTASIIALKSPSALLTLS